MWGTGNLQWVIIDRIRFRYQSIANNTSIPLRSDGVWACFPEDNLELQSVDRGLNISKNPPGYRFFGV